MKLEEPPKKVIRSSNFQESKFNIQASAKAFTILSSGLYSDKYNAIVRELCVNASDAHTAAGIPDKPIKVTLPGAFNNSFSVKDYGHGIDPEEFVKIYTTYFYSTKSDTNEQVGCFGLGSKSPFAYTNQFNVENCYGGVKYLYSCFKNEMGEPSVALLSQSPTDDTGVCVSFPVGPGYYTLFESACKNILRLFDVTPDCNIAIEKIECSDFINKTNGVYGTNIRMGQVIYRVNDGFFNNIIQGNGYIINVPVGYIDITPSRESIEYTERTKNNLRDLSDKVADEITKRIMEVNNKDDISDFRKHKELYNLYSKEGICIIFISHVLKRELNHIFKEYTDYSNKLKPPTWYRKPSYRKTLSVGNDYTDISITSIIAIDDDCKHKEKRVRSIFDSNDSVDKIIVFNRSDYAEVLNLGFDEEDLVYLKDINLPKPPPRKKKEHAIIGYEVRHHATRDNMISKQPIYNNLEKGLYITNDEYSEIKDSIYLEGRMYDYLSFLHRNDNVLTMFTKTQYDKLGDRKDDYLNLFDHLYKIVNDDVDMFVKLISMREIEKRILYFTMKSCTDESKSDNLLKDIFNKYYAKSELSHSEIAMANAMLCFKHRTEYQDIQNKSAKLITDFSGDLMEVWNKYPLAQILETASVNHTYRHVAEYIDLIEQKMESK